MRKRGGSIAVKPVACDMLPRFSDHFRCVLCTGKMGGFSALRAHRWWRNSGSAGCRAKPLDGCSKVRLPSSHMLPREAKCPSSNRSEEHTSELQSLMRISYAVYCLK